MHANSTATSGTFQHDGVSDVLGRSDCFACVGQEARAWGQRHTRVQSDLARSVLQSEFAQMARLRPNKDYTLGCKPFSEACVFGQKAIAWMNGLRTRFPARGNNRLNVEIASGGGRWSDTNRVTCVKNGPRKPVWVRIDRDALHAHPEQSSADPGDDFATVGDQHFREHVRPPANPI